MNIVYSRVRRALSALLLAGQLLATHAVAGTIRHDRLDSQYTGLAADPDYASVGRVTWSESGSSFIASGTLIRDNWVLTAAHVIDGTDGLGAGVSNLRFLVGGSLHTATDWFPHANWAASGGEGNLFAGWDIGLMRLAADVTNVQPASLYTVTDGFELGQTATLVGYGQTGTGLSGAVESAGTKRAGQNIVDVVGAQQTAGSNPSFRFGHDRLIAVDFDQPLVPGTSTLGSTTPLELEYLTAPGDSGGGLFLSTVSGPKVAGVTSLGSTVDGSVNSDYGDRASYTRVSSFIDWIEATIDANTQLSIPGDYNGDGTVNTADYDTWRETFGQVVTPGSGADGDGNGIIEAADFTIWQDNRGNNTGIGSALRATAVPEPTTGVVLAGTFLLVGALRRRAIL